MIGILRPEVGPEKGRALAESLGGKHVEFLGRSVIVTSSLTKQVPDSILEYFYDSVVFETDAQLTSVSFLPKRQIVLNGHNVGAESVPLVLGPCSVESETQIDDVASFIAGQGLKFIRGSAFKPRTTPYGFQGLGLKGLEAIRSAADRYGLTVVSETRDTRDIDLVMDYADVIQIGTKAMYDYALLEKAAKSSKPILLKRGFGTSIQEFLQIAEFLLSAGKTDIILCERGIRTFETKSRFTLDLAGAVYLLHHANVPLWVDPSHAMGQSYGVSQLGLGALATGADGLLVEMHPDPTSAKTDASQQIDFIQAEDLISKAVSIAAIFGRKII